MAQQGTQESATATQRNCFSLNSGKWAEEIPGPEAWRHWRARCTLGRRGECEVWEYWTGGQGPLKVLECHAKELRLVSPKPGKLSFV